VDVAGRRARAEAWRWFREENYHRAARAFENAALARPDDTEARIGELFCHLSVGAIRTAVAVLGELTRRDTNPFTHPLDMTGAYGDPRRVRELRIGLQLRAAGHKDPAITALLALVLWYSGEHDEALSFATALARDFPDDVYASWAPKMRQATRDNRGSEERRP
jgi:thioredoxin-like negative regulator of GroEL